MNDMNFFSTFLDKKLRKRSKQVWIIFILLAIILAAVGVYFNMDLFFSGLKTEIATMKKNIESLNQQAGDQKLKMQLLQSYRKYDAFIDKIDREAKKTQTLTAESLEVISKSMPEGAYLLSCNILDGQAELKGKSKSSISVGTFCKNLQLSGIFSDIRITNITMDETGTYDFDINCMVEGGGLK